MEHRKDVAAMADSDGAGRALRCGLHVCGLAVALGVGLAIATAGASDASASPGAGSAESVSHNAASGPETSARSGRGTVARRPAGSSQGRSNRSTVPPTVSENTPEVHAPVRASLLPPRPPTPPAARAALEPTPARGDQAAAAVSTTANKAVPQRPPGPGPNRKFMQVTIFKGIPFSWPRQTRLFVNEVSGQATFTDRSVYDLNNVDQLDWNKLSGITFTPLRPDTDAIMVAWRYNVSTNEFEVAPYYNVDRARILPAANEIISVPIGSTFDFDVDYQGVTVRYGDSLVYKPAPPDLEPNFWTSVRISSWFGGTSLPPRTLSFWLRLR